MRLSNKTRLFIGQCFVSESECEWESVDVCEIPSALGLEILESISAKMQSN